MRTPLRLIRSSCLLLVALCSCGIESPAAGEASEAGHGLNLSEEQRQRLEEALAPYHEQYDPAEQMVRRPFSSPGYHTTLKGGLVHPTRDSLNYAVALLDTGNPALLERAEAILRRVIGLQDQDPASRTYGIWSWFLEEPLAQMSPPDWNWADFCGVQLLQAALDHRERLSPQVRTLVDEAIRHAARSVQRRNVGPGYTNIAIMGTYVTLVTGEFYGMAGLREYGLARLKRFYDYTREQGAFTEYNSPTYTLVALQELARLRQDVNTPDAQPMIEELYRTAWQEIATHFHVPTRQWGGPHSRCYRTLMQSGDWGFLSRATEGRVEFGAGKPRLDEARISMPCPRDLEPLFQHLDAPRQVVKRFIKSDPPIVGTTYLHPDFTLGTVNRGDLWNQRRALVAYWNQAGRPAYLHLRLLHDDYDFAAGRFFSVQREGRVLAGINLATDGGDRHPSLDRIKNGRIQAKDLRVRFEFGGAAGGRTLDTPASLHAARVLRFGDLSLALAVPFAAFGEETPHWESGHDAGESWLDLVLFSGDSRTINLAEIEKAAVGFALRISDETAPMEPPSADIESGRLRLAWKRFSLELPLRPGKARDLQASTRLHVE